MIDWLKLRFPLPHAEPIAGGQVMSVCPDGSVEWLTHKWSAVRGSWALDLRIRTYFDSPDPDPCTWVEVDGNPAKFIQGHNLFGTDDLVGLALHTMHLVADLLGIVPDAQTLARWHAGEAHVQRADLTGSLHMESRAEVRTWLRAAHQTAYVSHRGRGHLDREGTLYFGLSLIHI